MITKFDPALYSTDQSLAKKKKTVFIKKLKIDNKNSIKKRTIVKILFYEPIKTKLDFFRQIKKIFNNPIFLIHYNLLKYLFINLDAFKQ